MRSVVRIILSVAWALWFGGIIGVFVSVTTLFGHSRELAIQAAPVVFHAFEKYQLILAAIALLAAFAWRVMFASRRVVLVFALLAVTTLAAVFETTRITPRIDAMRVNEQTHTPAFARAHGFSMIVYCGEAITLLLAGIVLFQPAEAEVKS